MSSLKDVAQAALERGMARSQGRRDGREVASSLPTKREHEGIAPLNGHGPMPSRGKMNKAEARYADHLDLRPDVVWWGFEVIKLNVGSPLRAAWYTPDFLVQRDTGGLELHEFKGHWRTAARLRIKAAARYPFRILAIKELRDGAGYDIEEIR